MTGLWQSFVDALTSWSPRGLGRQSRIPHAERLAIGGSISRRARRWWF